MIYFLLILSLLIPSLSFADNNLLIGLAAKDLTPSVEEKIPLGGYGSKERRNWPPEIFKRYPILRMFAPSKGTLDPIRAKVMYIQGQDKKLLFISLDVIGVTREMRDDLLKRLKKEGFNSSNVIISGTHTHSGPGALSTNLFWQIFAMDRFQKKFYKKFMDQIMSTIHESVQNATEGTLHTLSFATSNLVRNRRGPLRPVNPNAHFILAKNTANEWMGGIVNYAVHGTSLGAENLFFSADTPGSIERELEKMLTEINGYIRPMSQSTFLFINGAEGDISPNLSNHHEMGVQFAKQTEDHWNFITPLNSDWQTYQKTVYLYKPKVNLSKCIEEKWMPKGVNIGLGRFIDSSTTINQVRFGSLWLMSWPGEATTEIGLMLKEEALKLGATDAWVLGLTNDHLAYFTTPEEFKEGGYESCVNFFGANGGLTLINAHKKLSTFRKGHL